jgi:outer membrane protein assembly factor BamB
MIQPNRTLMIVLVAMAGTQFTLGSEFRAEQLPGAQPKSALSRPSDESPTVSLFRGGPQQTGAIAGRLALEHPKVLAIKRTDGDPGEPLLADGVIYVGDRRENLHAIRIADGSVVWSSKRQGFVYAAPARRGEVIFVASQHALTALARSDGSRFWRRQFLGDATESSPLIVKDRIIVGDSSGTITAVDFDGKVLWTFDVTNDDREKRDSEERGRGGTGAARPRTAASDGTIVYQPIFDQSRIVAIDLKAGKRRWGFQAKGWIFGEPAVTDQKVFFGSQDHQLYCLDKTRKSLLWSFPTTSRIEAGVAVAHGSVFCGSCDGRFFRVDAETGKEIWSYQTPRSDARPAIYSAPLCTDDAVYFGSFDGHLYCLSVADGALKWRFKPIEGAEITGSPQTDGRRIVLAMRRNSKGHGENAIVILGENASDGGK